jgi:hypothetical protein
VIVVVAVGEYGAMRKRRPHPGTSSACSTLDSCAGESQHARGIYPIMAGLKVAFSSGVILGLVLGYFGVSLGAQPPTRFARTSYTAPLLQSPPLAGDNLLMVGVRVDLTGRVQDYRLLTRNKWPRFERTTIEVKNMLIFTTFHPAPLMGSPVAGTAVLWFPKRRLGQGQTSFP